MRSNMQRIILEMAIQMPDLVVSNPLDDRTCDYCLPQIGKRVDDLENNPPFEECEDDNGCRCFYAVEKEI